MLLIGTAAATWIIYSYLPHSLYLPLSLLVIATVFVVGLLLLNRQSTL
jgi:hypothetical protein